jgi:hypothetical protein
MEGEALERACLHHYKLYILAVAEANFDFIEAQLAREYLSAYSQSKSCCVKLESLITFEILNEQLRREEKNKEPGSQCSPDHPCASIQLLHSAQFSSLGSVDVKI